MTALPYEVLRPSVIVPTKNSERTIRECLESLQRQTYRNFEVIVVDGRSTDGTRDITSEFGVKLVDQPGGNLSVARNLGVANAEGDPVVFLDSDCVAPDDWLAKIAAHFKSNAVSVLGGPDVPPQNSKPWEQAFALVDTRVLHMINEWGPVERIHGCNVAYSARALKQAGGFNEELDTDEEIEAQRRIEKSGGIVFFDPDLTVFHYRRENLRQYVKQHFWYGVGKGQWMRRDRSAAKLSNLGAMVFLVLPVLLCLLFWSVGTGLLFWLVIMGTGCLAAFLLAGERRIGLFPYAALTTLAWIYSESAGQILGLIGYSRGRKATLRADS